MKYEYCEYQVTIRKVYKVELIRVQFMEILLDNFLVFRLIILNVCLINVFYLII